LKTLKDEVSSMCLEHSPVRADGTGKIAYSIREAAAASSLSRAFLYVAIKDGRLVARKCGARTIIETPELRRFIASLPKLQATG